MISSLRGRLIHRSGDSVVIEVGGVGYRALVGPGTLAGLGPVGADVLVHTHLHVREDALTLFAFAGADERDCFEALIGAHGVGPSLALAILSVHSPAELRRALADGDKGALTLVPGVGTKTAARLLVELRSRLGVPELETVGPDGAATSPRGELRAALAGLGYEAGEIASVLPELPPEGRVEDLVRDALRLLAGAR